MAKIEFIYTDESAKAILKHKELEFVGEAFCHPEDRDMASERTGLCIAEARAIIAQLVHKRNNELIPQLKILKHLYHNTSSSGNFNEKSYEAHMMRSQIHAIENQLTAINNEIAAERKHLKEYIDLKDKVYKRIRAKNNQ